MCRIVDFVVDRREWTAVSMGLQGPIVSRVPARTHVVIEHDTPNTALFKEGDFMGVVDSNGVLDRNVTIGDWRSRYA